MWPKGLFPFQLVCSLKGPPKETSRAPHLLPSHTTVFILRLLSEFTLCPFLYLDDQVWLPRQSSLQHTFPNLAPLLQISPRVHPALLLWLTLLWMSCQCHSPAPENCRLPCLMIQPRLLGILFKCFTPRLPLLYLLWGSRFHWWSVNTSAPVPASPTVYWALLSLPPPAKILSSIKALPPLKSHASFLILYP